MGIYRIKKMRCTVDCPVMRVKGKGITVGAFVNPYWHPYVYSAYHIVLDDGTQCTALAKNVKLLSLEVKNP
ncbi:hypothetical protein [Paenibacillus alvei]|uniref:hypothetical protein n=1 Tax=Paenibacillus alvei TaxID=44250 RepID=UPI00227E7493|nr:hypothetical protein [Paenibacillus alvei]MCY7487928.1 hypothetical protein [Paenibacillus alvei]